MGVYIGEVLFMRGIPRMRSARNPLKVSCVRIRHTQKRTVLKLLVHTLTERYRPRLITGLNFNG